MRDCLETAWAGQTLYFYEITGSTNTDAKQFAKDGDLHGTVVVADTQYDAKGRRGRTWQTFPRRNLYFTIVLRPTLEADKASMLTLVMAMSVVRAIREQSGLKAEIKWPNDIVINKKKVCGILTEMILDGTSIDYVVIGVGINVNQEFFQEEIKETATCLHAESGRKYSRAALLKKILAYFEKDYETFLKGGDMFLLQKDYNAWLVNKDAQVKVLEPKGEYTGIARGINEKGELLVELENGQIETVYAGEVSVRGLYGYV